MDWDTRTIDVYNKAAKELAEHFADSGQEGTTFKEITLALKLSGAGSKAKVIEIGCGAGRASMEINSKVSWYEGFDPSSGMLKLAGTQFPTLSFALADALTYSYPKDIDVIFAFASLLHVSKTDLSKVFKKVYESLKTGGVFLIVLKERPKYTEEIKKDEYGQRMFYYYNPEIIKEISKNLFKSVYVDHQKIGHTDWFTQALKKTS